ncbi:MAG: PKD domain-containing protein [Thermoproteota archaeon]
MSNRLLVLFLLIILGNFISLIQGESPISTIVIDVPEYTVEKIGGFDYVDIPGGGTLLIMGKPRVPFYSASIEYPAGCRVQAVTIRERSELTTVKDLNLSMVTWNPDAPSENIPSPEKVEGWYPEKDFGWQVLLDPDGSSTLMISVFPFYYNPGTKEAMFYRHYEFDVAYIFSAISVLNVNTEKPVYDPGEEVTINVFFNNSGEAKDVIASVLIKRYGLDDVVDGLPLRTLHNVAGQASFTMIWNSKSLPTGDYYVEVMLNDTHGNWLDRRTCMFRLGRSMINVTRFNVEPQHFKIGDEVRISLEALNTGSTALDGKYVFMVQGENSTIWNSYQNFTSLSPRSSLKFTSTWNTSSAKKSALYYVIGYVSYESQTTPPVMIMISTNYLPIAKFSYTPAKAGLGEKVMFDASASNDPDGSISLYKWEFGDGGEGTGVNVNHYYHGLGDYLATLTVTDNEGASNSTVRLIRVVMMYDLNVSSNIAVEIPGSGRYKEEEEVTLTAPSSVNMLGLLGLFGAKYVFKQWTGFLNSTDSSVSLVFTGYEPRLEMRAIYSEDYTNMILTVGIVCVVITVIAALSLRRRSKKLPPVSPPSSASK